MRSWIQSILFIIIFPYALEFIKETSKELLKQIAKATVTWGTNKALDSLKEEAKPKQDTAESLTQRPIQVTNVTNVIIIQVKGR